MTIMVTGGTGFIGARIIRKLLERGQDVVSFDLAPPRPTLDSRMNAVPLYRGDVTDMAHLMEAVNTHKVSRIIHLAALLPPASENRPGHGLHVNIQGANNVFEVARWASIERVVYASSIAVYGVQDTFGQHPINEDDPANPVNVYGMTKAVNDFAAAKYIDMYGLDLRGIRICTVFGHGRFTGMTGLIGGLLMSNPAVGKPIDIPSDPFRALPHDLRRRRRRNLRSRHPQRLPSPPGLHQRRSPRHLGRNGRHGPRLHTQRPDNHRHPPRSPRLSGRQQPNARRHRL